jgi:hypothetical protein
MKVAQPTTAVSTEAEDDMADMSGDAASMASGKTMHTSGLALDPQACLACSLLAIGAIGAVFGLMRSGRSTRRWPALTEPAPGDFTPPHGDKLLSRR